MIAACIVLSGYIMVTNKNIPIPNKNTDSKNGKECLLILFRYVSTPSGSRWSNRPMNTLEKVVLNIVIIPVIPAAKLKAAANVGSYDLDDIMNKRLVAVNIIPAIEILKMKAKNSGYEFNLQNLIFIKEVRNTKNS